MQTPDCHNEQNGNNEDGPSMKPLEKCGSPYVVEDRIENLRTDFAAAVRIMIDSMRLLRPQGAHENLES